MATLDDLDGVVEQYHAAAREFAKGNPGPVKEIFSHRDDVTLANPFGLSVDGRGYPRHLTLRHHGPNQASTAKGRPVSRTPLLFRLSGGYPSQSNAFVNVEGPPTIGSRSLLSLRSMVSSVPGAGRIV